MTTIYAPITLLAMLVIVIGFNALYLTISNVESGRLILYCHSLFAVFYLKLHEKKFIEGAYPKFL